MMDMAKMAGLCDTVEINHTELDETGDVGTVKRSYEKWQCVSAHTARRSFASNMYERDFPTLMIMAITGHKTEKAFLTYIKISADKHAQKMYEQFIEQEKRRSEK